MLEQNSLLYLKGTYNHHIVFFSCSIQELRDHDQEVQICWIENNGEVKIDYVKISEIKNISKEELED